RPFCILHPSLSLKQRALTADAARALDKAKMMRFDEKSSNFYCTEIGRIASHFDIQCSSVETYNEMLRPHMNETEVIVFVNYFLRVNPEAGLFFFDFSYRPVPLHSSISVLVSRILQPSY
ncbi:hypothetical protein PRUPE_6G357800, partial [Prunus persica]